MQKLYFEVDWISLAESDSSEFYRGKESGLVVCGNQIVVNSEG